MSDKLYARSLTVASLIPTPSRARLCFAIRHSSFEILLPVKFCGDDIQTTQHSGCPIHCGAMGGGHHRSCLTNERQTLRSLPYPDVPRCSSGQTSGRLCFAIRHSSFEILLPVKFCGDDIQTTQHSHHVADLMTHNQLLKTLIINKARRSTPRSIGAVTAVADQVKP